MVGWEEELDRLDAIIVMRYDILPVIVLYLGDLGVHIAGLIPMPVKSSLT